jgi:hypothetical protein
VGKWVSAFFNLPKRGEDLQQYKVQNNQEKRENVVSLHWKNFSSKVEVEVASSNIGHNIYRF